MTRHEFKSARFDKGWNQTQAAGRLGVSQAHLNCLEHGKRRLTPDLVRRATAVYGLSPEVLPTSDAFTPKWADDQRLTEMLAQLEYPGFAHVQTRVAKKNPSEVLLMALAKESLDGRVAEALPWLALKFAKPNAWLVENARKLNLQNKLGFVVTLARRVAESQHDSRLSALRQLEQSLDESRLVKEGFFYRPPYTESEKDWLKRNRTEDAAHWNLLSDMKPEHLQYVR
jgi:transcriptional regulator with XRE-family HTH domain